MKKKLFSVLFVLFSVLSFAQLGTGITGKIVDAKNQKPLENVVVTIQNTNLTEVTNAEGKFTFTVLPEGDQIVLIKSSGLKDQLLTVAVLKNKIVDLG